MIVNPALTEPGGIPHPPVGEFIYRELGIMVGYDNFRLIPLIFSFINLFLLFYLVKTIFDTKTALWSAGLFIVSFYSVLASLMVDTDGAVMPAFFLIACIGYYKLRKINFQFRISNFQNWISIVLLFVGIIGGFFVKASFIIAIGALALDFAFEKGVFEDRKKLFKYILYCIGLGIVLVLVLLLAKVVFPFFPIEKSITYWKHFANSSSFLDRGWLQTFIQFVKAVLYTSPLLILPLFFIDREIWQKTRPFFLFIFLGLFFYLIAFDFSIGALDRYFQFLVVPLCIIAGAVFAKYFTSPLFLQNLSTFWIFLQNISKSLANAPSIRIFAPLLDKERGDPRKRGWGEAFLVLTSISIFLFQFFNHFVPPLYPKTEWISRVISLKWNFLFPFTGGSGPTGFYISFLFIALIWLISLAFVKKRFLLGILVLGLLYNAVFIEEYLFGKINGSPYELFKNAKEFIVKDKDIKKVVVYNDIGGYEIQKTGKYNRRMYATPQFEDTYKKFFENFSGHILYIDIPKIGDNNFYSNYLNSCKQIYKEKDKYITAKIFKCNE